MTLWISLRSHYLILKKYFLSAYYVPLNDLRISQPSLPLKTQENKCLNKPPKNYDRRLSVFFQRFRWVSFKLCCGRHLWPLFHNSVLHTVTAMNFLWFSGGPSALMAVSYLMVIKGFLWLPSTPLCWLLISCYASVSFTLKKPEVLKLKCEPESPIGIIEAQTAGPTPIVLASVSLGRALITCISNKFSGDVDAAGQDPTLRTTELSCHLTTLF